MSESKDHWQLSILVELMNLTFEDAFVADGA